MVKHTQTVRRVLPTNCLSVFEHFVGLALKWLTPEKGLQKTSQAYKKCWPSVNANLPNANKKKNFHKIFVITLETFKTYY